MFADIDSVSFHYVFNDASRKSTLRRLPFIWIRCSVRDWPTGKDVVFCRLPFVWIQKTAFAFVGELAKAPTF